MLVQMAKPLSSEQKDPASPSTSLTREFDGGTEMNDHEKTVATVARLIEQLHNRISSPQDTELTTARLLGLARGRKEARTLIGSHAQAMPLFISIMRGGTPFSKKNVARILSALCKDEELQLKVLLGGCIPPLLSILKSESVETRKAAAEAIYEVSSAGLLNDHVGMKIFITEGVVPALWDQLNPKKRQDKVVEGFVTGALRNLCGDNDDYWRVTLEGGGVDVIVGLLFSKNPASQSNAASLLARVITSFSDSIPRILDSGTVKALLQLLSQSTDISVRASAADALEALTSKSAEAKKTVRDADGIHVLIGAIIAPSKELMQGELAQALQTHSTLALANVCGSMPALILYLGELSESSRLAEPVTDIIGALAYALMIFEQCSGSDVETFDQKHIEDILVKLLKARDTKLIQERILEALGSLYSNSFLSGGLHDAKAKRILIGLITMAADDLQEHLIVCLSRLCCNRVGIWEAIGKREGIQILISFLGLSSEQHQEYAVELLTILTDKVDDSKWAVTAAGGIPPLVQLLETGSHKSREYAVCILWNLCSHSDDILACVERAGAIPSLLCLLRNGGPKVQEGSAKALRKLILKADSAIINQLLALFVGDTPISKAHVMSVLGHVLTIASQADLIHKGSTANKGLQSLVQALTSSNEETKEHAASVLADLFSSRQDLCDSFGTEEFINSCMKLLTANSPNVAAQLARALGALSHPTKKKSGKKKFCITGDVKPLMKLVKTSSIDFAETAIAALANLLSDPNVAAEALAEDAVSALIRILGEGTVEGKKNATRALYQLLKHFPAGDVLSGNAQCCFAVLALVDSLSAIDLSSSDAAEALEVIALLARTKQGINFSYLPWSSLAAVSSSLETMVQCLADGSPLVQDKATEILSRICADQSSGLGSRLIAKSKSITSLATRTIDSSSFEIRVGATALLICAAKADNQLFMDSLEQSGYLESLLHALVDMMRHKALCSLLDTEIQMAQGFTEKNEYQDSAEFCIPDPAAVLGGTVALWLLCIASSFHSKNREIIMNAGGLDVCFDRLSGYSSNPQAEYEDDEGIWIGALLLAVMFQDANVVSSVRTISIIPLLALLLKSDEVMYRYFAAQAIASLACHKDAGVNLGIANSGAVAGLINLLGYVESDMPNLVALSREFSLVPKPEQVILEHLFEIEDVRLGSTARKSIPLLVDLLKPIADRPAAPPVAVKLLTRIADGSDSNKLLMAEAGALEALAKYLSLSPQDSTEFTISELLRILFSNSEIVQYEAALSTLNQLIAVLHLGSRSARNSAAGALNELFDAEFIRDSELAWQAVQPLVDMLNTTSQTEQEAALATLVKLTSTNTSRATLLTEIEGNLLENVLKLLSSSSPMELKINAARLCCVFFENKNMRTNPAVSECMEPLISLMQSNSATAVQAGVCAFERLLDDEQHLELAVAYDVLDLLVSLVSGSNHKLIENTLSALIKLGRDQTPRKLDMVRAGIIDRCLMLLPAAPSSLCSSIAELCRILTNSGAIARSPEAAKMLEPLFVLLLRSDFSLWGQHSTLQALVNILEKPQSLTALNLTPSEVIEPLISYLESPSHAIQQLGTELLTHLLSMEHFQQDITTKNAVVPLVKLAGTGILNLQQTAVKGLEKISTCWPKVVAEAGGILEVSKIIIQEDPEPPLPLWESAAFVLCNILRCNGEYSFKVPLVVLVKMMFSSQENTIVLALNSLAVHEKNDASAAEQMARAGAIDALLDLMGSHQCEEAAARLLESLFNNVRVREMKVSKFAIAPLSQYLLDPQTGSESGRLLAALALGDLSQHERLSRGSGSASACRALISVLEYQPAEDLKMVAICALQNFVMHSRTNRRAVAESGGILLIQELLLSYNAEVAGQAALLIKFLFSNHTLQEYVSNELIRSLTAALERGLWSNAAINVEILRTLYVIFTNFPKLRASEATTLCIPHLVGALKTGSTEVQESALDILYILQLSWSNMPIDAAKSQAMVAAEAIPILQMLIKTCPPSFHEKADNILHCLPGCLTVTINRGNNLKQSMGTTNAFCQLCIGNGPPRQTKVVSHSTAPEWKEGFTWDFDVPPKGQKLHIICKSKATFGKTTLGRVTIQIDKVVTEGAYSGLLSLNHDSSKDVPSRTLEIEITWSNRTSEDST